MQVINANMDEEEDHKDDPGSKFAEEAAQQKPKSGKYNNVDSFC